MFHLDDVSNYLHKYVNIVNIISILDRTFTEVEVLKPIYAAIAHLGIHIWKPYYFLLMDPDTNYSTLLKVFPHLYQELLAVAPSTMLMKEQCFHFVNNELIIKALPENDILEELLNVNQQYPSEIQQILSISLQKFAKDFPIRKGQFLVLGIMSLYWEYHSWKKLRLNI